MMVKKRNREFREEIVDLIREKKIRILFIGKIDLLDSYQSMKKTKIHHS